MTQLKGRKPSKEELNEMKNNWDKWVNLKKKYKIQIRNIAKNSRWILSSGFKGDSGTLQYEDQVSYWILKYDISSADDNIRFALLHKHKESIQSIYSLFRKGDIEAFAEYLKNRYIMWQIPSIHLYEYLDNFSSNGIEAAFIDAFKNSDLLIMNYTEILNISILPLSFYNNIHPIFARYGDFSISQEKELRVIEFTGLLINQNWKIAYDFIKSYDCYDLELQGFYIGNQTNQLIEDLLADKLNCLQKAVIAIEGDVTSLLPDIIEIMYEDIILNNLDDKSKEDPEIMPWKVIPNWTLFEDNNFKHAKNESKIRDLSKQLHKEVVVFIIDNRSSIYRIYNFGNNNFSFIKENDSVEISNLSDIDKRYLNEETDFSDIFQFALNKRIEIY